MGAFLERLQDRIYLWEVSTALTDEQADALYRAAGDIEVAYRFALQNGWGQKSDDAKRDYGKEREECRGTFNAACGSLAEFWEAMGEQTMSDDFAKRYDKPAEPAEPEPEPDA